MAPLKISFIFLVLACATFLVSAQFHKKAYETDPPKTIDAAVLGMMTGNTVSQVGVCAFVNSFRRTTTGRLVLFVPADKAHRLAKGMHGKESFKLHENVEVVKVDFRRYPDMPAAKIRHIVFRKWLDEHQEINSVALTDVRDVVFQQDIWYHPIVQYSLFRNQVLLTVDHNWTAMFEQPHMGELNIASSWTKCFDEKSYQYANEKGYPLSPFVIGYRDAIMNYTLSMSAVMDTLNSDCLNSDRSEQIVHNYLINYLGKMNQLPMNFTHAAAPSGLSPVDTRTGVKYVESTVYVARPGINDFEPYVLHRLDRQDPKLVQDINIRLGCKAHPSSGTGPVPMPTMTATA